jgi:hypothetical protein
MFITDDKDSLESFAQLWKKICKDCTVDELIKYALLTRNLSMLLDFDVTTKGHKHSKDCFDLVLQRAKDTKQMDYLIPLNELKENNNPDQALELANMITQKQEYENMDREPTYYELRISYPLLTSTDIENHMVEEIETVIKKIHPRMYSDHLFAKVTTPEEMHEKIEELK